MAGSVAHMLHVPMLEALKLQEAKLIILHNEAIRQRALNAQVISLGMNPKEASSTINMALKAHGPYTEGFYRGEINALKEAFGANVS